MANKGGILILENAPRTTLVRRNSPEGEYDRIFFSIALDIEAVYAMARKAATSAGRTSRSGPLTIKVTEIRPES